MVDLIRFVFAIIFIFSPGVVPAQEAPITGIARNVVVLCVADKAALLTSKQWMRYKESPVVSGITKSGKLFELYASASGSTFTIIILDANTKELCVIGTGTDLRILRPLLFGNPS